MRNLMMKSGKEKAVTQEREGTFLSSELYARRRKRMIHNQLLFPYALLGYSLSTPHPLVEILKFQSTYSDFDTAILV